MSFDEIDSDVRKCPRVVNAGAGSGLRYFFRKYSQPIAVYSLLFFESTLEDLENVVHGERADGRASDRIHRSREDSIHKTRRFARVSAVRNIAR